MYKSYVIDIPANEIAVAGSLTPYTNTILQLAAGGDATASFPVLNGIPFHLEIAGVVYIQNGENLIVQPILNGVGLGNVSPSQTNATSPFIIIADGVWDLVNSSVLFSSTGYTTNGGTVNTSSSINYDSVSSPSSFDFKIIANLQNGSSDSSTVTITKFKVTF